jgi:hypothetical protein
VWQTGLPDGVFSYQKSQFGDIFEGLGIKNGIFYGNWVHFIALWYILWSFGIHISSRFEM